MKKSKFATLMESTVAEINEEGMTDNASQIIDKLDQVASLLREIDDINGQPFTIASFQEDPTAGIVDDGSFGVSASDLAGYVDSTTAYMEANFKDYNDAFQEDAEQDQFKQVFEEGVSDDANELTELCKTIGMGKDGIEFLANCIDKADDARISKALDYAKKQDKLTPFDISRVNSILQDTTSA